MEKCPTCGKLYDAKEDEIKIGELRPLYLSLNPEQLICLECTEKLIDKHNYLEMSKMYNKID